MKLTELEDKYSRFFRYFNIDIKAIEEAAFGGDGGLSNYYTKIQMDTSLATKAATAHNHDDRYYTETEVNTLLANISSGSASMPLFNVEDFGAVGDGTTDDYEAIMDAWTACTNSLFGGKLFFPRLRTYYVDANVSGRMIYNNTTKTRALFHIPLIDPTTSKRSVGIQGVGDPYVVRPNPYNGGTAGQVNTASVLLVDYDTPFSWSSGQGLPSVFGGPDADLNGATGNLFSGIHFAIDGMILRQPDNPSLCYLNLEDISTAEIGRLRIDVNVVLDHVSEPTHPTGIGVLLPRSNNNVAVTVDSLLVEGHYGGIPITEHLDLTRAIALRCKVGTFTRRGNSHAARLGYLQIEQCPWIIAGCDPSAAGPNLGVVRAAGTTVVFDAIDIEDYDYGGDVPWMYALTNGAHIFAEPSFKGMIKAWYRINSGSASPTGASADIVISNAEGGGAGATGLAIYTFTGGDASDRITTSRKPENPDVPNVPTIGTATAGVESVSVAFTPSGSGSTATSFTVTSTPGNITNTGSSSPINVTGLTADVAYTFTVHASNITGDSAESANSNSATPTAPIEGEYNIFSGDGPAGDGGSDPNTTVGMEINVDSACDVTAIKYWKPAADSQGTVTGSLFKVDDSSGLTGTLVTGTTVVFTPSGTGWQRADLTIPIALEVGERYRVAVFMQNGYYAYEHHFWDIGTGANGITSGPITALSSTNLPTASANAQGSFHQGTGTITYPEVGSSNNTNFGVDLVVV